MTLHRKGDSAMFLSDRVVGMSHWATVRFIEANDLWDEVVDLEVDCMGTVTAVIH